MTAAIPEDLKVPEWDIPEDFDGDVRETQSKNRLPLVAGILAVTLVVLLLLTFGGNEDTPTTVVGPGEEQPSGTEEEDEAVEAEETVEVVEVVEKPVVADNDKPSTPPVVTSRTPTQTTTPYTPPRAPSVPTTNTGSRAQGFGGGPPPVAGSSFDNTDEDLVIYEIPGRTSVDSFSPGASAGSLSPADIQTLERIQPSDGSYSRSRALLLMNAERTQNVKAIKKYLNQLMSLEENRLDPVFLSKRARWYTNQKKYAKAIQDAQRAEQHWARIAPELQFDTKAEIYAVTAASQQGLFYASDDDLELLDKAIRAWKKYGAHAQSRQRMDMVAGAEEEIATLEYARGRLE